MSLKVTGLELPNPCSVSVSNDQQYFLLKHFEDARQEKRQSLMSLPLNQRKLPPSFFRPPLDESNAPHNVCSNSDKYSHLAVAGHHSQHTVSHSKSNSSPADINPHAYSANLESFNDEKPPIDVRLNKSFSTNKCLKSLTTIYSVRPLSPNYGVAENDEGKIYFLKHNTKETTWFDPRIPRDYQKWGMQLEELEQAHLRYAIDMGRSVTSENFQIINAARPTNRLQKVASCDEGTGNPSCLLHMRSYSQPISECHYEADSLEGPQVQRYPHSNNNFVWNATDSDKPVALTCFFSNSSYAEHENQSTPVLQPTHLFNQISPIVTSVSVEDCGNSNNNTSINCCRHHSRTRKSQDEAQGTMSSLSPVSLCMDASSGSGMVTTTVPRPAFVGNASLVGLCNNDIQAAATATPTGAGSSAGGTATDTVCINHSHHSSADSDVLSLSQQTTASTTRQHPQQQIRDIFSYPTEVTLDCAFFEQATHNNAMEYVLSDLQYGLEMKNPFALT